MSPSCTMRYAERSSDRAAARPARPRPAAVRRSPAARTSPRQRLAGRRRPGCGVSSSDVVPAAASRRAVGASPRAPCARPARRSERLAVLRVAAGIRCRTAPTWSTITLTAWATTSWSSRAIRARSSATATRAADSRSRSARSARSSATSVCLTARAEAKPTSQPTANSTGVKMRSPAEWFGLVVDDDRRAAEHDDQAHARLDVATQVAQEQRRAHPGEEDAGLGHDQPPVQERQGRAGEPHGRRRGEREPASREEQEHEEGDSDSLEPQQDSGRPPRIVPREDADHARERRPCDQDVDSVPRRETPRAPHVLTVLSPGFGGRPTKVGGGPNA